MTSQNDHATFPALTTVAVAGPGLPVKHLFVPCLFITKAGQYFIISRRDEQGSEEGDATNEQALYWSEDRGTTWRTANDGRPIITLAHGTSFDLPSAITGAWLFEDASGVLWAYYNVNQPFTWGANLPQRSTGGGEIRRLRMRFDGQTWRAVGQGEIVWGFRQRLPDGQGGWCDDVRVVSWNGLLRTSRGTLLMPVGGRSTVKEPQGAFWKLNRIWMLESVDGGQTWTAAHFVAGSESRCYAEPTIVETSVAGEIVCLLRVQYGTGNQLHRSVSRDYGRTWSEPVPTGLPNANEHGVKPYLLRTRNGAYVLVQTNEQTVIERTNLAIFRTDEGGLLSDRWGEVKTLHVRNRAGWWPGACYAWLAEDPHDGRLAVAFPGFEGDGNQLFFARLAADIFESSGDVEPNGVIDESGNHLPRTFDDAEGRSGFRFDTVRGRLTSTRFGLKVRGLPARVSFEFRMARPSRERAFNLVSVLARNGRIPVFRLQLEPVSGVLTLYSNPAPVSGSALLADGNWHKITCDLKTPHEFSVEVDGIDFTQDLVHTLSTEAASTLLFGGNLGPPDECEIYLANVRYFETTP